MREGIDDPSVLLDFPVHVRTGRRAGHSDERDGLAPRDSVADGHERRGRVVVAALNSLSVLHAHPAPADLHPTRRVHDAAGGGDDDGADGCRDVDTGVAPLAELADRAGDWADEAARGAVDAPEPRAGGGIGAEVETLAVRDATTVELELRLVEAGAAHAGEPTAVRTKGASAEEVRERRDRAVRGVGWIPHRDAVENVAARYGRRHHPHQEAAIGGPPVHSAREAR